MLIPQTFQTVLQQADESQKVLETNMLNTNMIKRSEHSRKLEVLSPPYDKILRLGKVSTFVP